MPLDLAPIRALLDIHMGRGTSKSALHAHILAYEYLIPDLLSEVGRLTAELAAAQAELTAARRGPVVEWEEGTDYRGEAFWTCIRRPLMLRVQSSGWDLVAIYEESYHELDSGPETGPEGKDKCEAAYLKAAGHP